MGLKLYAGEWRACWYNAGLALKHYRVRPNICVMGWTRSAIQTTPTSAFYTQRALMGVGIRYFFLYAFYDKLCTSSRRSWFEEASSLRWSRSWRKSHWSSLGTRFPESGKCINRAEFPTISTGTAVRTLGAHLFVLTVYVLFFFPPYSKFDCRSENNEKSCLHDSFDRYFRAPAFLIPGKSLWSYLDKEFLLLIYLYC